MRNILMIAVATLLPGVVAAQQPGVTGDKIVLGQAAVFSGPAAQLGIQMRNGIQSYFAAVNEKGGVNGRKLELVTEDDKYEAKEAPGASKKLIEEHKVFALLGYVGTPTGTEHIKVTAPAKVPLVGMFTGADSTARSSSESPTSTEGVRRMNECTAAIRSSTGRCECESGGSRPA